MEFVRQNKKLISTISIATILLVLVFNVLFYIFAPIQSQGDPANFIATPRLESREQATTSATTTNTPQGSSFSLVTLSIMLVIALLLVVVVFAFLKYSESQRRHRDTKRKEDLKRLAQAFEAYHQEHGQYPLSSTYLPQYYTGINLSNDWNYYGLPDKEHMVRYLPDWPLSDPSIDYHAKHQVNQYIYYPKDNGQKFFLYAHLEAPTKEEQIDYNQQDNLLRSWGNYNYRLSSHQEQPSEVHEVPHPQHIKTPQSSSTPTNQPITPTQPQVVNTSVAPMPNNTNVQQPTAPQSLLQNQPQMPAQTTPTSELAPTQETLTPINQAPVSTAPPVNPPTPAPSLPQMATPNLTSNTTDSINMPTETRPLQMPSNTTTAQPVAANPVNQPEQTNPVIAALPSVNQPTASVGPEQTTDQNPLTNSTPPLPDTQK